MAKHGNGKSVQTPVGPMHVVYVLTTIALLIVSLIAIMVFG